MKLIPLYEKMLASFKLSVDDNGYVSTNYASAKAAKISGKRVVLPTTANLRSEDWENQIIFHPLREAVTSGESPVLEWLRKTATIRLNLVAYFLFHEMLVIAGSTDRHKDLTPDQAGFLSVLAKIGKIEDKTLNAWVQLMDAMPFDQTSKSFVHFYLKRAGKVGNRTYDRAGIVNFPLYNELKKHEKGEQKVFGVTTRHKDRQIFIALMEHVFPHIDDAGAYSAGSSSQIAPYLDAFVRTFFSLAVPLNEQLKLLGGAIKDGEDMIMDDSWVGNFDDLDLLRKEIEMIPMQAGNSTSAGTEAAAQQQTQQQPAQAAAPQPFYQPQPMSPPMNQPQAQPQGPKDMASFMRSQAMTGISNGALMNMGVNPMMVAAGVVPFNPQQPQMNGFGMPGFGMVQPQQQQQALPSWMYNNPQPAQQPGFGWGNNNGWFVR